MPKFVYEFTEGNKDLRDLLGGKGAGLAEMTNLGLPVPHGFTITTDACRHYLARGTAPDSLAAEVTGHLRALERSMGRKLGDASDPLLVSVRSGAKFSMPGMMDTVLNVGLSDASVEGLAAQSGNERFAWDAYRRLIQMFGKTVLGIDGEHFSRALDAAKKAKGAESDTDLDSEDLKKLTSSYKDIVHRCAGREFPQDPREQMDLAVLAVFDSWNSDRAVLYRRQERIPADLGTAVSIVAMVFGNMGDDSGTGVAFTRDPGTGARGVYGDYLSNAQGEDVVAGIRNTVPLQQLEQLDKASYDQLTDIMATLEAHYRDLCDIEFTIERGKLWMLQTRVGKRTAGAAFRIATQLARQGMIDLDEALSRVSGAELARLMFPRFDASGDVRLLTAAVSASPGAAVGKAVFDSAAAVEWAQRGERVILVRRETNPDDLDGMIAAQGVLTSRGGKTSHAAVVARGMGKTCVCGAEDLVIDSALKRFTVAGVTVAEGDVISIDGTSGKAYLGEVPVVASNVVQYFEGSLSPDADELVAAVHTLMTHADARRSLGVRANADNGPDCARSRRFGASGVGLVRTEHMFLGERRQLVEDLILAPTDEAQQEALDALEPLQRSDYVEIFEAMDGLPVTIRLIDPPLHEFLPDLTDLSVRLARKGKDVSGKEVRLLAAVRRLHEQNPMLGLRGVRLLLVIPGLLDMQVRAIANAAAQLVKAGKSPKPEIMIPLTATIQEMEISRDRVEQALRSVEQATGVHLDIPIGTMIEVPRAALNAGDIARSAEFFSYGTNDLTQMAWGFSRDDVEGEFFGPYMNMGIFGVSPFETIDPDGVGRLIKIATAEGRATRPDLQLGVCGEHGGDPASVWFFHEVGLDYVSCSPFRVPIARLEAGRAAVASSGPLSLLAIPNVPCSTFQVSDTQIRWPARRNVGAVGDTDLVSYSDGDTAFGDTGFGGTGLGDTARWVAEPPKRPGRTEFQRDRARVLHSSALRRLAAKTQVIRAGSDDFPRTRLTHSLECAQIGRELGAALGCDPDLVDAACLAHDLGHPPFGHNGESALAALANPGGALACGGFEGNAQSLRLLTRLEPKIPGAGLNLTRATLDAALKYPWLPIPRYTPVSRRQDPVARSAVLSGPADETEAPRNGSEQQNVTLRLPAKYGAYQSDAPVFEWIRESAPGQRRCLEAQVMDWADDVAYSVHDVEDGLQAGLVPLKDLADPAERARVAADALTYYCQPAWDATPAELETVFAEFLRLDCWQFSFDGGPAALAAAKNLTSELVGRLCRAAEEGTRAAAGPEPLVRYAADLVVPRRQLLECALLKGVTARYVMARRGVAAQQAREREVITDLALALARTAPAALDPVFRPAWDAAGDDTERHRVIIDQVASLTNTSALAWHARLG